MAATPQWKCYQHGNYLAACKHAEDAAILMAAWGTGTVIVDHKHRVWVEGQEAFSGGESYDRAAQVMHERRKTANERAYSRIYAR